MRKKSDELLNFSSLEQFFSAPVSQPAGTAGAEMVCTETGILQVKLPEKYARWDHCWLLMMNSADKTQRQLFPCAEQGRLLRFDISGCDSRVFQSGDVWLGYLALEQGDEFLFSRLKQKSPSGQVSTQPQTAFWTDKSAILGTVAHFDASSTCLSAQVNPDRGTLFFSVQPHSQVQAIGDGRLYHRTTELAGKQYPFLFSVIMPVYNAEEYLAEAVESVLNQDIGFEENAQLILVDDGSTDSSPALCDAYAAQYPNNVKVLHKQNGGVSAARNAGISLAEGKYVQFLDSDDKLSLNVFSTVAPFFDAQYELCDLVAIPQFYFERRIGGYYQNTKFELGNRVIDLWAEPFVAHFYCTASVIKRDALQDLRFCEEMMISEDVRFVAEILMKKMRLGVVTECGYWYRKRLSGGSLIDTSLLKKYVYLDKFKQLARYLQRKSRKQFGLIPKFIQYTLLSESQPRFTMKQVPPGVLTKWEERVFRSNLIHLLKRSDDDVILNMPSLSKPYRMKLFELKYGRLPELRPGFLFANMTYGNTVADDTAKMRVHYDFIRIQNGTLRVEGYATLYGFPADADVQVYLNCRNDYYLCDTAPRKVESKSIFGPVLRPCPFIGELPITKNHLGSPIRIALKVNGTLLRQRRYSYNMFCPVNGRYATQYYCRDGWVLFGTSQYLQLEAQDRPVCEYEADYIQSLQEAVFQQDPLFPRPAFRTDLTQELLDEITALRQFAVNYEKKRPIWLISDRPEIADDNGAALFRYLMSLPDLPVDVYFAISKNSPDYEKMAAVGPVLDYFSMEHFQIHLVADMIISSQFNAYVKYPFSRDENLYGIWRYYSDMVANQRFVFLQHGITKDDMSPLLNRYRKDFAGFITAALPEYQSILDYDYFYEEEKVWLTGFPRFDLLYKDEQKQVTLCPTWRNYQSGMLESEFVKTDFFQFYQQLINDPRLQSGLEKSGYRLCLKLHPELLKYAQLFEAMPITVLPAQEPYRKMFAESNLLITDYSSAVMDFAYLRKPVLYCMFDREEFFSRHYTPGYFSYEDNGFGPITTTVEDTVSQILSIVEGGCQMAPKYQTRADAFFLPADTDNCRRVCEKLLELQSRAN